MYSTNEIFECKFCLESDNEYNLISPCNCNGSLKYIHTNCLNKYINNYNKSSCEICKYKYNYIESFEQEFYINQIFIYLLMIIHNIISTFFLPYTTSIILLLYILFNSLLLKYFITYKIFEFNIKKLEKIYNIKKYLFLFRISNEILYRHYIGSLVFIILNRFCLIFNELNFFIDIFIFIYILYTIVIIYILNSNIKNYSKIKKITNRII